MATAHTPSAPVSAEHTPQAPVSVSPTNPQNESVTGGDRMALLLWIGCMVLLALLVLADLVFTLFR